MSDHRNLGTDKRSLASDESLSASRGRIPGRLGSRAAALVRVACRRRREHFQNVRPLLAAQSFQVWLHLKNKGVVEHKALLELFPGAKQDFRADPEDSEESLQHSHGRKSVAVFKPAEVSSRANFLVSEMPRIPQRKKTRAKLLRPKGWLVHLGCSWVAARRSKRARTLRRLADSATRRSLNLRQSLARAQALACPLRLRSRTAASLRRKSRRG